MDLVFMADKGGVGKSTLAYHVATRMRQLGLDAAIYDLDSRRTTSAWAAETGYVPAYDLRALQATVPEHAWVVWDTAPHPDQELRAELAQAGDLIVIIANGDRDSMAAAGDLHRALVEQGARRLAVVFNAVHPTGNEGAACVEAARAEGLPAIDPSVRRYACYIQARWDGCSVIDHAYSRADNAWQDISAVTDALIQQLDGDGS